MCLTMSLRAQQHWLLSVVQQPLSSLDDDSSVWLGDQNQHVRGGADEAAARLGIYRHGYFARLVECLEDDYPAVRAVLGSDDFELLCLEFISAHPSHSPSLNFYGAPFAEYCRSWDDPRAAFVSDLARLEWAVVEAIHAESLPQLPNLAQLVGADFSRVHLQANPSLRLLGFGFDVGAVYQGFKATEEGDEFELAELPLPAATNLAVCRAGDRIWRVSIAAELSPVLERLLNGDSLGTAIERGTAGAEESVTPAELQEAFANWVGCGFFCAVT